MRRSEFIARVAGGAFAVSTAGAMTDEGRLRAPIFKLSAPFRGSHMLGRYSLPFNLMPTIFPSLGVVWC
jgi:hypothetical protein